MRIKLRPYFFSLLTLFLSYHLLAQDNKFNFVLEYSANYSNITDELVDEQFKLSHGIVFGVSYGDNRMIQPTIGLAYMNTGNSIESTIAGALGIESIKYVYNHNYLYVPFGAKMNFGKLFLLPEIGLGINVSNKTRQITVLSTGESKVEEMDSQLNNQEFNKVSIPLLLSIGTDFKIVNQSFLTGVKAYYGLNKVVNDSPRNNHYYGMGFFLAIAF